MTLVCYLDDSGNKGDRIVTLAGYIAPAHNWLAFERHARELFDVFELPYLHTVDLHGRRGKFRDWTRENTAKFANDFYRTLGKHAYSGFAFSVLKSSFEAKKSVYNVEHQSSPIGFCLHGIVALLVKDERVKDALALPGADLSFVVEKGNKNDKDICRRFKNIKKQDPERFASITFEPKKEKIALQAADFLAYFSRRLETKDQADKHYKDEAEFFENAIGGIPHRHIVATDFEA